MSRRHALLAFSLLLDWLRIDRVLRKKGFDLALQVKFALSDSWAKGHDLAGPALCVHVLRPKRPGSALRGPSLIDGTTLAL